MHECSVPFFFTNGNKEIADKYAIYLGTSHCEPMMRNTNGEWHREGKGEYNYLTNRKNVLRFWEERVKQLQNSDDIYTLGMRGIHDGAMQGAKSVEEQKAALTAIIKDQRDLLAKYKGDVTRVPQVFIPYKEVLDAYDAGLKVPEDVTLMWCDDNYGYITHFPSPEEAARPGGNGIYYHVSYWGQAARLFMAFHRKPLSYLPTNETGIRPRNKKDVDTERGRHKTCRIPNRTVHGHGLEHRPSCATRRNVTPAQFFVARVWEHCGCLPASHDAGALPPCIYTQARIHGKHSCRRI